MEAAAKSKSTTSDARLSALRARNKKVTCFFTSFLVSLFLVTVALITYLVLDINSESIAETAAIHSSPTLNSDSDSDSTPDVHVSLPPMITQNPNNNTILADFLQTAADQLLNATSVLESTAGMKNCTDSVRGALVMIRYAIKEINDPMVKWRIETAEWRLKECVDDLKEREMTSMAVKTKVVEVQESVRKCADLALALAEPEMKEYWSEGNDHDWVGKVLNAQNVFLFIFGVLELSFIGFMLLVVCTR